jgi:hypothetical protein
MNVIPQLNRHRDRMEILERLETYMAVEPIPGQLLMDLCDEPGCENACPDCPVYGDGV